MTCSFPRSPCSPSFVMTADPLLAHASYTWVMISQLKNNTAILHVHIGESRGSSVQACLLLSIGKAKWNVLFIMCHEHSSRLPSPFHSYPRWTSRQKNIGKCCNYVLSICSLHGLRLGAVPGLISQLYHILVLFEDGGSAVPPVSHNWNEGRKM